MPALVSLIFVVLIGWPLVKLLTTAISRRRWDRQRQIRAELEGDPRYGELERRIITEKFEEGKGSLGQLALPFVAFFGGWAMLFASPIRELSARDEPTALQKRLLLLDYPEATATTFELLHDKRFEALGSGAFELQMLRYPIATMITALAILPPLGLFAIFHGLRTSLHHVARHIVESSRQTVKTFAILLTSVTTAP